MTRTDVARRLAEHPKLMGVLFTAAILLSQAGMVIATDEGGCRLCGP